MTIVMALLYLTISPLSPHHLLLLGHLLDVGHELLLRPLQISDLLLQLPHRLI